MLGINVTAASHLFIADNQADANEKALNKANAFAVEEFGPFGWEITNLAVEPIDENVLEAAGYIKE